MKFPEAKARPTLYGDANPVKSVVHFVCMLH